MSLCVLLKLIDKHARMERTPLERVEHQGLDPREALEVGHGVGRDGLDVRNVDVLTGRPDAEAQADVFAAVEDGEAAVVL